MLVLRWWLFFGGGVALCILLVLPLSILLPVIVVML